MTGLLVIPALILSGIVAGALALAGVIVAAVLWLAFLPFRLLFWVLAIPIALVQFLLVSVAAVLAGTISVVVISAIAFGVLIAIIAPLAPILFVVGIVWGASRLLGGSTTPVASS